VRELGEVQVAGDPTRGPATVIATGQPEIYPVMTADPARPEAERLMRELCFTSAAILPLRARGAVIGAMTLLMGTSGRRYDAELVELAESLAGLAALALDNARLFAEQREVAGALQRTLLPSQLPAVPGAELAARYRAAGRSNQVGGDFYDVLDAGNGEWAFVIGDVAGKGADAAAVTSLVRATLQAGVLRGDGPRDTLALVNEALRRRSSLVQFCSALHGRIRPIPGGGLDVELLSAGHPPPLVLRRDGVVEQVRVAGTLLGISAEVSFGTAAFTLAPGDVLLLYTDGATELRGSDPWRGEQVLHDTVLASVGVPLAELVERVEHEALVLGGGELRDDLALLAIAATVEDGQ
jgi:phosphoserine phosphatase RsbU/P